MSRRLLALALLCAAGCAGDDLCAGWDQSCVGLRVNGPFEVDQLEIQLSDGVELAPMRTPAEPGPARSLPVTTALHLRDATAQARLRVTGLLAGQPVGVALQAINLLPGRRQIIDVVLEPETGFMPDAGVDHAVPRDLASQDIGKTDGPPPPSVRRVFLLSARQGSLGRFDDLRVACDAEGMVLGGSFLPLVGYTAVDSPAARLAGADLNTAVVLPNGAPIGTIKQLLAGPLLVPINRMANGATAPSQCIWTNFTASGETWSTNDRCGGSFPPWTTNDSTEDGTIRRTDRTGQLEWAASDKTSCDGSCHVLCLEE
jgi:hypothetical protein